MSDSLRKIPPHQILATVDRICQTDGFSRSPSLKRLLHYLVGERLEGRSRETTSNSIAIDVFDFDVASERKKDPTVRIQMNRLREALTSYYAGPSGREEQFVLEVPETGYCIKCFVHSKLTPARIPFHRLAGIVVFVIIAASAGLSVFSAHQTLSNAQDLAPNDLRSILMEEIQRYGLKKTE